MFKELKLLNSKSDFVSNFLTLLSGRSISQIFPILISPIISRLFDPQDFGGLAIFLAVATFVNGFMTLAYDTAIMLPEKKSDSMGLVKISFILTLIFTFLVAIVILFAGKLIAITAGDGSISKYLYFAPIIVFSSGMFRTLDTWFTRKKRFGLLNRTRIFQTVIASGTKLITGFASFGLLGLVAAEIGRSIIGSLVLLVNFLKEDYEEFISVSKKSIRSNLKTYIDFPKYNAPQGILDMVNQKGFIFIFSSFFGVSALGTYNFGVGKVLKPLKLIGPSLSKVFYEEASSLKKSNKDIWPLTKRIIIFLLGINVPLYVGALLWGPDIIAFVFGNKWREAGEFIKLVMPWQSASFIASTISTIPIIFRKQKRFFIFGSVMNIGTLVLLFILGIYNFPIKLTLLVISFVYLLFYIFMISWFKKISTI